MQTAENLQSSILNSLRFIIDRLNDVLKLEITPCVPQEDSLSEKESSSCSYDSLKSDASESKEQLSNFSLSSDDDLEEDQETDNELLDDFDWPVEKKSIDENEGLKSEQVSIIDKLQATATKSLGHFTRF